MDSNDNKLNLPNVTLVGIEEVEKHTGKFLFAAEQCTKNIEFGDVKLLSSLNLDHPSHIKIDHLPDVCQYSRFMFEELYKYIDTDFLLIFQSDGFILNHKAWSNDFLEYDYIGAPWFDGIVGNGGFSFRSKKLMRALSKIDTENPSQMDIGILATSGAQVSPFHTLAKITYLKEEQPDLGDRRPKTSEMFSEDHLICRVYAGRLREKGFKYAPEEVAARFSLEHNWLHSDKWNGQLGFHNDDITDISNWESYGEFEVFSK